MTREFAHTPDIGGRRWSMLAYRPADEPKFDIEYNYGAAGAGSAKRIAAFEAEYLKRSHVKVRDPQGDIIYDGPTTGIVGRQQGWA